MNLLLWRHAAAEDRESADPASDLERRLTKRGLKQAELVAAWLQARLPADYQLLVSPARRTRETADALTSDYRVETALAPDASTEAVLAAVNWPEYRGTVVVVGHQPTLGAVASRVLTGREAAWSVKKGSVWWLNTRDREEGSGVVLRAVMSPDLV
jgi:phosphohistidine phosphatase